VEIEVDQGEGKDKTAYAFIQFLEDEQDIVNLYVKKVVYDHDISAYNFKKYLMELYEAKKEIIHQQRLNITK
jgi:hypothetical protein